MTDAFGEELRRWRKQAGFSLAELARRVHYSKSHLSNVESGRKPARLELVKRCDVALGAEGHLIGLMHAQLAATTSAKPALRPAQLPANVTHFVGRTATIAQLDAALSTDAVNSARIIAIDGAPGVGKTALAIRWAHERADQFPDGVLYADLHSVGADGPALQPAQVLDQFLLALEAPVHDVPEDLATRSTLYRSLLAERRMLIVLDNAATSEQVRPLLPGSARCLVVTTSRTRLSGLVVRNGARRIALQPLHHAEAVTLLRHLVGHDRVAAESDAATSVAERCAYLPLALRIAAGRVTSRLNGTLAELAEELANDRTKLEILTVGDDPSSALPSVFSWSYEALPQSSARMFRRLSGHPGQDITAAAAAALVDTDHETAALTLDHLASVSLLDDHIPGRYRLSPLLHTYAANRLRTDDPPSAPIKALDQVLAWYLHACAAAARVIAPHQRHLPLAASAALVKPTQFADHREALIWCDAELNNLVAAAGAAVDEGFDTVAWQIAVALGTYFDLRKVWVQWIDVDHIGLSAARREGNRVAEAWLLTDLAAAYRDLERLDAARDILEESLAIQHETGDRHGEALSLIQLGRTLAAHAQLDKALSQYRAALQILPSIGDQHGEATALLGVAEVYCAAGEFPYARDASEAALDLFDRLHDRRGKGAALCSLAVAFHGLDCLNEAIAGFDHALAALQVVDDHHGQAVVLSRRGHTLHQLGHGAAADASWQDALAIFDRLNDPRASDLRAQLQTPGPVLALPDDKAC